MGKSEVKEYFEEVNIISDYVHKKSSPSLYNNTLYITKDRVYGGSGGNWHIKYKELKLDATSNNIVIYSSEDDGKRFEVSDRDSTKVERFIQNLVKKHSTWKAKSERNEQGYYQQTKKRSRSYGSSTRRKRQYDTSFDKIVDDIVSSDDDEHEFDTHDTEDDLHETDDIQIDDKSTDDNHKSVCLDEEDTHTHDSVAVTDEDADEEEILEEPELTPVTPIIAPRKNKGIVNYFPTANNISKSTVSTALVQDTPPKAPSTSPHSFFKPITTSQPISNNVSKIGGLRNLVSKGTSIVN